MRLPRSVLKADGLTLESFHVQKAVCRVRTPEGGVKRFFEDDRYAVRLKVLLIVLAILLAALLEIVR